MLWLILINTSFYQTGNMLSGRTVAVKINDWAKILDAGGQVDTFILDFEKAFDTPPQELLKCKLHGYGIMGKNNFSMEWFIYVQLATKSCSQWCKIAMGTYFVWCAAGHCSRSTVVLLVYKWHHGWNRIWDSSVRWWLCLLSSEW